MTRLMLLTHFADDSEQWTPYSSITEAVTAEYEREDRDSVEYSCLLEAIQNIHNWYTLDRTEEFIEAYKKRQRADLINAWSENPAWQDIPLNSYLRAHEGPAIRKPSVRKYSSPMLAAE
jgi:hypothetical protein